MNEEIKKLLRDLREYIEETEVKIDSEWGCCYTLRQLQEYGKMPKLYDRVNAILANAKAQLPPESGSNSNQDSSGG